MQEMLETISKTPISEIYSFIGLALITFAFLPQSIKTLRTHETESLSLKMYIMAPAGGFFMFLFGVEIGSWSVIFWEVLAFSFAFSITVIKVKNVIKHGESW